MASEKEPYTFEPHAPTHHRDKCKFTWAICRYCGLVYLRNDFTALCIKLGCNYRDSPRYEAFLNTMKRAAGYII